MQILDFVLLLVLNVDMMISSVKQFDYELPEELIAQVPIEPRTASRLLHLDRTTGDFTHRMFERILSLVTSDDLIVFNDTKVFPARLFGRKSTGGKGS